MKKKKPPKVAAKGGFDSTMCLASAVALSVGKGEAKVIQS